MNYEHDELYFVVSDLTVSRLPKIEFPYASRTTDDSYEDVY